MRLLKQCVLGALFSVAILVAVPAFAVEGKPVSRADLMGLARQFVDRIGGKLEKTETPSPPAENPFDRYEDGEILYFQIRLPGRVDLERTITSIKQGNDVMILLSDFVTAADFAIQVNPSAKTAAGWYIREDNLFALDAADHTVRAGNKTFEIAESDIAPDQDNLYVRGQALAVWIGFEMKVNLQAQRLEITPSRKWPIQEKIERENDKNRIHKFRPPPSLPLQDDPYDMVSVPNVELQTRSAYIKPEDGSGEHATTYIAQASGDIAGHSGKLRLTGNNEEYLDSASMNFYKESNEPDLLGPLQARRYEFGDIGPVTTPLVGGGATEVGARASNKDPYVTYDTLIEIDGDATPGWDVELFRGDQYLATTTADETGRYVFNNIVLFTKQNDFRIIQYGPQGEIREETRTYSVDPTLYDSTRGLYDVSATLSESQLYSEIDIDDEDKNTPHIAADYERQITPNLAVQAGLQALQEEGDQKAYIHGGLVHTFGNTILNADAVGEASEGTYATALTARQTLGNHNIVARTEYSSEDFSPGTDIPRPAELMLGGAMSGSIPFEGLKPSYTFDTEYRKKDGGETTTSTNFGLAASIGQMLVSNTLHHTTNSEDTSLTTDSLSLRGRALGMMWRATTDYEIQPDAGIESYDLTLTRGITRDLRARLDLEHAVEQNYTQGELSLDWRSDHALISPSIAYDSDGAWAALLNVKTAMTKNPYTNEIKFSDETLSDKGGVAARVFLDKNGDNEFSEGDELLQDVKIKALHANRDADTDDKGEAFLYNIPDNRVTDVFVDEQSFTDPYWVSGFQGVSIRPRAGHISRIDFPIHLSGEIDGTLRTAGTAASNIRLHLYDMNGKIQQSAVTDIDGFYWMTKIPPGDYSLAVDATDARNNRLQPPPPMPVQVTYQGTILNGQDINLEPSNNPVGIAFIASFDQYVRDNPALEGTFPASNVVLNLGTYRSNMLMVLTWYRLRTFQSEFAGGLIPLVEPLKSQPAVKTGLHTMRAAVPPGTTAEQAYNSCLGLAQHGYDCTVEIMRATPPEQVIGMNMAVPKL